MFIELIDVLRCHADHEDFPLVASITARVDRDIVTGVLGCPACGAEYPIGQGVAVFGDRDVQALASDPHGEAPEDAAMRCAAMLDLFDPGGVVVLSGSWARGAAILLEIARTSVLLLGPVAGVRLGGGISALRTGGLLPLAPGAIRGIALDEADLSPAFLASAARALKPGARLVAPVGATPPPGIVERARDDRHWVGAAESAVSAPIQLTKSRGR